MQYDDALKTSLQACWSYVYHKYRINPSIISIGLFADRAGYIIYPFELDKDGELVNLNYIVNGYHELSTEGMNPEDEDNYTSFVFPAYPNIINKVHRPRIMIGIVRGFEQRTKDACAICQIGRLACHKFFNGLKKIEQYKNFAIGELLAQFITDLESDPNFDTSDDRCDFRREVGTSDDEYLYLITALNNTLIEKLYKPLHLTDPDAIYYLYHDIDGFCKEYNMDAPKREVVTLYRDCFRPLYDRIYAHVIHYGNEKFIRNDDSREEIISSLKEMKDGSSVDLRVCMYDKSEKNSSNPEEPEFSGYHAIEVNQAPCSVGMSSIYFMTNGGKDEQV